MIGGALAKGVDHTIQRACAVQNKEPEDIIEAIKKANFSHSNTARLLKKLGHVYNSTPAPTCRGLSEASSRF